MTETTTKKEPFISFKDVYKSFGEQRVCNKFNLDVFKGETVCIVGPSGVGKTVTIKMIIGLILPDAGEVWFDGKNVAEFSKDEDFLPIRKRTAIVFQGSALFDSMTVFENVAYPLRELFKLKEGEIKERVQEKLEWVGLPDASKKYPGQLSGGMKKRIGLARAIVTHPEVVLYDEPTTGLDPITTVLIAELIARLQERIKCTSLVVTHDIPVAESLSDRAAFMYDGKVRALGRFQELKESKDNVVRGYLAGDPELMGRSA